jgi:hypothetical protein
MYKQAEKSFASQGLLVNILNPRGLQDFHRQRKNSVLKQKKKYI